MLGTAGALHYASGLDLGVVLQHLAVARHAGVWLPFIFIPLSAVQFQGVPPAKNNEAERHHQPDAQPRRLLRRVRRHHRAALARAVPPRPAGRARHALQRLRLRQSPRAIGRGGERQASILSYLDVFTILSIVALASSPLSPVPAEHPEGSSRRWPLTVRAPPGRRLALACSPPARRLHRRAGLRGAEPLVPASWFRSRPAAPPSWPACRWPSRSTPNGGRCSTTRC